MPDVAAWQRLPRHPEVAARADPTQHSYSYVLKVMNAYPNMIFRDRTTGAPRRPGVLDPERFCRASRRGADAPAPAPQHPAVLSATLLLLLGCCRAAKQGPQCSSM